MSAFCDQLKGSQGETQTKKNQKTRQTEHAGNIFEQSGMIET